MDPVARANGLTDTIDQIGKIHVQKDVWLGANGSVLAGVTIGEGCVAATASVVTKNIPAGALAGGIPACIIRRLDSRSLTIPGE